MDQRKEIKFFEKPDSSISEIQEYHSKILHNHLNPPILSPDSKELSTTSALITPNHLYEQKLKQSVIDKKQEEDLPKIE